MERAGRVPGQLPTPRARRGDVVGRHRARPEGRWCPERSLAEACQSLVHTLSQRRIAAAEQRQDGARLSFFFEQTLDGLTDQLRFGLPSAVGGLRQAMLEAFRKVDGRLLHACMVARMATPLPPATRAASYQVNAAMGGASAAPGTG